MRPAKVKVICRWCGDALAHGSDCSRDDELRSSCNCGTGPAFFTANLAADFDEFAAIMRRLKLGRAAKRH